MTVSPTARRAVSYWAGGSRRKAFGAWKAHLRAAWRDKHRAIERALAATVRAPCARRRASGVDRIFLPGSHVHTSPLRRLSAADAAVCAGGRHPAGHRRGAAPPADGHERAEPTGGPAAGEALGRRQGASATARTPPPLPLAGGRVSRGGRFSLAVRCAQTAVVVAAQDEMHASTVLLEDELRAETARHNAVQQQQEALRREIRDSELELISAQVI